VNVFAEPPILNCGFPEQVIFDVIEDGSGSSSAAGVGSTLLE